MARPSMPYRGYMSLSVKDLLEAREAYHVHLTKLENVIATAVGWYRFRSGEPGAASAEESEAAAAKPGFCLVKTPRTLENSFVRPWSWPSLLVFVERWATPSAFKEAPDQAVPRYLYLPDGRVVPTCVILVEKDETPPAPSGDLIFPDEVIGGGYPVLTDVQGDQHFGSIGCLVTDGTQTYALTAGHVAGPAGQIVSSIIGGETVVLGVSDPKQVGRLPFTRAYPGFPGPRVSVNLDAGLVRLEDIARWTAQVYGIGEIDEPEDLNADTITLDWIGCPVRAFGAASGDLHGEIQGLFYRYRAMGGFDTVADFLIGPRSNPENGVGRPHSMKTRPGDSGTIWFVDKPRPAVGAAGDPLDRNAPGSLTPIAMQWGGHRFLGAGAGGESSTLRFALATCLSTICRELQVEVIRDWNIGFNEYWGQVGHYKIGAMACDLLTDPKLKRLFKNNKDRIGISDDDLKGGAIGGINSAEFVPLADVPDDVWKKRNMRKRDNANHYADLDTPAEKGPFKGKTLLDLTKSAAKVDPAIWNQFYDGFDPKPTNRGALPFRVWQIYQEMVEFVRNKKVAEYVCAAGILAHYVGDACQPLHASHLHDGRPGVLKDKGVHSAYETNLLNQRRIQLIDGLNKKLKSKNVAPQVTGGKEAAVAIVKLLRDTLKTLPPMEIIEAFRAIVGQGKTQHMWDELGEKTIQCIARGCRRLAMFWESAWKEGEEKNISDQKLGGVSEAKLQNLYENEKFIESFKLPELEAKNILK